jgi:hypothetical protein
VQSSLQLLPPAEIGTAQQEIPVATMATIHTLQLTTEEIFVLYHALNDALSMAEAYDEHGCVVDQTATELLSLLRAPIDGDLKAKHLQREHARLKKSWNRLHEEATKLRSANEATS